MHYCVLNNKMRLLMTSLPLTRHPYNVPSILTSLLLWTPRTGLTIFGQISSIFDQIWSNQCEQSTKVMISISNSFSYTPSLREASYSGKMLLVSPWDGVMKCVKLRPRQKNCAVSNSLTLALAPLRPPFTLIPIP